MKCPECEGVGSAQGVIALGDGSDNMYRDIDEVWTCKVCNGKGWITVKQNMRIVRSWIGFEKELQRDSL